MNQMLYIPEKKFREDDEISLTEIYEILRKSWIWVVALAVLGATLGGLLAFMLPKKFQASVYVEPPLAVQYMEANALRTSVSGLKWVSGEHLYGIFLNQLLSDESRHDFFENVYLPSLTKKPQSDLEKNTLYKSVMPKLIAVKEPVPKKGRQLYSVEIQASTGKDTVDWMRAFLARVESAARVRWIEGEQKIIDVTIKNIEKDLMEKYELTRSHREDREVRLDEAFRVAKAVGQLGPQLTTGQLPKQDGIAGYADGSSLYARGVKSLGAEIEILREREDDSAFIDGLREAQAKLKSLRGQHLQQQAVGMYRIDGQLLEPAKPNSPKKGLLIIVGFLLGGFCGVLAAFIRNFIMAKNASAKTQERSISFA